MRGLILLLCMYAALGARGQQFGAFPPYFKWRQIETDTARIIHLAAVAEDAQRIATLIHRMAAEEQMSMGKDLRRINTVLHNYTTLANGYVALAPFRSEYYLIPSTHIFSMGANPWQEELAIHEYRHVQQYNNLNKGLSKFASRILGEEGQALLNGLSVPDWFFEGDAVHAETVFTPQGRGRIPYFFNGYKSLFREGKNYSWMKLRNGSMKDYVPNHYELGYLLVNYGRLKWGTDFWQQVTADAAAFKSWVYPFQSAFKKHAGQSFPEFRKEALAYYKKEVEEEGVAQASTVTRYYFPQPAGQDSLIYLKSSYRQVPAFYLRDKTGDHRLTQQSLSSEQWFSYRQGKILYTAYNVHPRWSLVDYSNLVEYDLKTKQSRKLTTRGRYYTPDYAPDGRIVSVFVNDSVRSELHLLTADGEVLQQLPENEDAFYLHPRFQGNDYVVYAERLKNSQMALRRLQLSSGRVETLLPATDALLGHLFIRGDQLYFNASLRGKDEVYVMSLADKTVQRLSAGNGAYFPAASADSLYLSTFATSGLLLQSAALQSVEAEEVPAAAWKSTFNPYPVAGGEKLPNLLRAPTRRYAEKRYKQGAHLLNFHSWRPYFAEPEFSLSLFSDNLLNSFSNELFYMYNQNETSHAIGWRTYYGGLFPILNASVSNTQNRTLKLPGRNLTINEWEAQAGYYIPLNFSGGKTLKHLSFGNNFNYRRPTVTGFYRDSFALKDRSYLHHFVSFSQRLPRAVQHIFPHFGYALSGSLRHFISHGANLDNSAQWLTNASLFLPSLGNHSLVLTGSLQSVDTLGVTLSNRFVNARGYDDVYFRKMWRLSGNYHLPLLYPDKGIGNVAYLLRVRSNLFFDYSQLYRGAFAAPARRGRTMRSAGAEIYFDTKWWNQLPVSFGVRMSHLLDDGLNGQRRGDNVFEFIVPVDLIPR